MPRQLFRVTDSGCYATTFHKSVKFFAIRKRKADVFPLNPTFPYRHGLMDNIRAAA
jgi:hypothetical protein